MADLIPNYSFCLFSYIIIVIALPEHLVAPIPMNGYDI